MDTRPRFRVVPWRGSCVVAILFLRRRPVSAKEMVKASFDPRRLRQLMVASQSTLAVAESLTTGRMQASIGEVSGASDFFLGGVTAYNLDQKVRHLGVDRDHAKSVNCVSQRVAREMAFGAAELFGSHFAISSTGYAEACSAKQIDTPFAYVAIWRRAGPSAGNLVHQQRIDGEGLSRIEVQSQVAAAALMAMVRHLETDAKPHDLTHHPRRE